MDIRTYDADSDVDAQQMTHFDAHAELASYVVEVGRLRAELARQQDMATHAIQAYRTVQNNVAELGKALHMALAERDAAYTELDAHRRELDALRDERSRLLAANVRLADERNAARAELATMRQRAEDAEAMATAWAHKAAWIGC